MGEKQSKASRTSRDVCRGKCVSILLLNSSTLTTQRHRPYCTVLQLVEVIVIHHLLSYSFSETHKLLSLCSLPSEQAHPTHYMILGEIDSVNDW